MNQGHVLDSHILIYHINNQLGPDAEKVILGLFDSPVYVSVISRIEVLGWKGHSEQSWDMTTALLNGLIEIGLEEEVVQVTIDIRRRFRIKPPDAIIAASAISLDIPLVTRNIDDFKNVENLRVINAFQ